MASTTAALPGHRILTVTMATTAGFVIADGLALIFGGFIGLVFVTVSLVMFIAGCVTFIWAFVIALGRSQTETVAVSTIYGLAGTKAPGVRLRLFGSIAVEVVVALIGAALQPFSVMAFGVLAPMFAIGMTGLWGARYGGGEATAPGSDTAPGETAKRAGQG